MKKRVNESEIELAKKSSKVLFVISFLLLILLFAGFGLLYFMNVDLTSFLAVPKKEVSEKKEKERAVLVPETETVKELTLDVDDTNIQKLYTIVKVTNKGICEDESYGYKNRFLTGGASTHCKFSIASSVYRNQVKTSLDGKLYVTEKDVKNAYDSLFGTGSYEKQESIPCLYKTDFIYNGDYYFTEKVAPEENTTIVSYEKALKAVREGDRLSITSAVLYYESNLSILCKDPRCEKVLEKLPVDSDYGKAYFSLYVDHNQDQLYKYNYHFELDRTGFYRYVGYDRETNEN